MRGILDSIAARLDGSPRDISRYMTGLLVFLGLLGTFWGLIETVSSVGSVIRGRRIAEPRQHLHVRFTAGWARRRRFPAWVFRSRHRCSASAGLLVIGLPRSAVGQAQNRFYTELEDWLSTTVYDQAAEPGSPLASEARCVPQSSACEAQSIRLRPASRLPPLWLNLAEAIQGLVHHARLNGR